MPFIQTSEEIRKSSKIKVKGFVAPDYRKYSLLNVSSTILSFYGVSPLHPPLPKNIIKGQLDDVNKIVILLIDALGYNQFEYYLKVSEDKFSRTFIEAGNLAALTSTFPSTTTTAYTTLHSELSPQEHGMPGLFLYLKELRVVADMIELKPAGDYMPQRLLNMGFNPDSFINTNLIFEKLKKRGIISYVISKKHFMRSGLSRMLHRGANYVPYISLSDMMVSLRRVLEKNKGKNAYIFVYWYNFDGICHLCGPNSEEAMLELKMLFSSLKEIVLERISPQIARETTLIIIADHGQTRVSSRKAVNLAKHPNLLKKLVIPFAGDPRAAYLYVKPNKLDEVKKYIADKFGGAFFAIESEKALKMGLFGVGKVKDETYDRIGDLILISKGKSAFFYPYSEYMTQFSFKGFHGGLTEDEMLVPFICAKMDKIRDF